MSEDGRRKAADTHLGKEMLIPRYKFVGSRERNGNMAQSMSRPSHKGRTNHQYWVMGRARMEDFGGPQKSLKKTKAGQSQCPQ